MNLNMILLRYLVSLIITFFAVFSYQSILGKNVDFLAMFHTYHMAFDGLLLAGILLRAFAALFFED